MWVVARHLDEVGAARQQQQRTDGGDFGEGVLLLVGVLRVEEGVGMLMKGALENSSSFVLMEEVMNMAERMEENYKVLYFHFLQICLN